MTDEFCSGCGRQCRPQDRFCRGCGEARDAAARAAGPIVEAESLAARGMLDDAVAALQRAIGAAESPELHAALATLYLRRGGGREARRALERALVLDPRCAVAHAFIGGMLMHDGHINEARERLDLARGIAPDDLIVLIKRAEFWLRLGILDRASQELRHALQNGGGSPHAREMAEAMYAATERRLRHSFTRKIVPLPSLDRVGRLLRRRNGEAATPIEAEVQSWP